jgi:multidrug resistance efflux pump
VPAEVRPGRRARARALLAAAWCLAVVAALWMRGPIGSVDVLVDPGSCQVVAPENGVVGEVRVVPGRPVEAGAVLVRLDDADARLALDLAHAEAQRASLERVARRVGLEGDRAVAVGRLAVESEQAVAAFAEARGEAERARVELADVDAQLASRRAWQADGIVSIAADDPLRSRRVALTARMQQLSTLVDAARRRADAAAGRLVAFDGAYLRGPGADAVLGAELAPLEAAAEVERVAVRAAEARLVRLAVRGGCAGTVEAVHVTVGAWVPAGAPLVTVTGGEIHAAMAWPDESDLRAWPTGARVSLRGAFGVTHTARVVAQSPRVSEMPARLWRDPATPRFGRPVYLALDAPASVGGERLTAWGPP